VSNLPTLYKLTSTGAVQYWRVLVIANCDHTCGYDVWTEYGHVDGKEQATCEGVFEGKNVGKANETSPYEQACLLARSKFDKKLKSGYVLDIATAKSGGTDDIIAGGILPMLAHKFADHADKIAYPCAVQPKLDGIRCIAILKDGNCTLWSRTRKQIKSMVHIERTIEAIFQDDITLDGELYLHSMKADFEQIVSLVRKDEYTKASDVVEYHVYDVVAAGTFRERQSMLLPLAENFQSKNVKMVETQQAEDEGEVFGFYEIYKAEGYEGAMIRNLWSPYINKRSKDLLKLKEMDDAEFKIVGIEEGKGKLVGHAIFLCETIDGKEFAAKMKGDTAKLKAYFDDHSLWLNKELTVQYQGFTKYGVPRFPVGLRLREKE
jgi:DNA ligase 1